MFERREEFTVLTRVGETIVAGATAKEWAVVGQKHTKRNQRKISRYHRFYEGAA